MWPAEMIPFILTKADVVTINNGATSTIVTAAPAPLDRIILGFDCAQDSAAAGQPLKLEGVTSGQVYAACGYLSGGSAPVIGALTSTRGEALLIRNAGAAPVTFAYTLIYANLQPQVMNKFRSLAFFETVS